MTVVIADDHAVVRSGFALLLEQADGIEVVGTAADGVEAYNAILTYKPTILLLDISMPPGQSGLIACKKITHDFPETHVVILTMFEDSEYLFYTLRGGAAGYILKSASSDDVVCAIRTVAAGGTYISPSMAENLRQRHTDREKPDNASPYEVLSNRELEVLTALAKGYTNKEIADMLFISIKTVETHRTNIYAKLGIASRSELVSIALKHKLLNL
ncbi:MAG: response regulator transcription factor [Raoultibacter sp.]